MTTIIQKSKQAVKEKVIKWSNDHKVKKPSENKEEESGRQGGFGLNLLLLKTENIVAK